MANYLPEPEFRHGSTLKTGVLLVNLGTPDAPDAPSLKRYLKQFLSDHRVVEIPRPIWWLILNGIILNIRPKKSAKKYASIWTAEGSPLKTNTEKQCRALERELSNSTSSPLVVKYAMRYGNPSIPSQIMELKEQGCENILLVPLYPQYAASTTGSSMDALFDILKRYRNTPGVRVIRQYHDHPAYINALASRVEAFWQEHGRPEKLIMSFHGVPRYTLDKGDPYHCQCHKTGRLLAERLGLQPTQYMVTFQSLFGRAEWIKPYTEPSVVALAKEGINSIHVVCPGFPADCLETIEEIGMEVKAAFMEAGGRDYHYIPALNDDPVWINALTEITLSHLQGWLKTQWNQEDNQREGDLSQQRALALGAPR
ncbi:MAG: ferrochelatase [Ferrovum sp. 37-45-19]|uniref:ferrochelatase n=1 Tax=Ferrovum sp. JA12 TaxID=1356299 RepID=UPI000702BC69|nr:ferrochelatase [Ferrovum sp. JA12]OYV80229.1 MAG: ferrochelatase [Ferrovum sp. 21-44-67]OYV94506.1 MAG: ferrochelatase [Ferrovum sp. 37-45-19]OZB33874.1 MAG: ferrochelatase [Ferrovum sp. 34-44-207]HQT81595.1 ferrochelatase [Ferrovaceae bacterium]KRH78910.1 ferrochelatase [Ferrovum sp. JA12]